MQQLKNLASQFSLADDREWALFQIPGLRQAVALMEQKIDEHRTRVTTPIVKVLIDQLRDKNLPLSRILDPKISDIVYRSLTIDADDFKSYTTKFSLPTAQLKEMGCTKPENVSDELNAAWRGHAFVVYPGLAEKYEEETETEFFFSFETHA